MNNCILSCGIFTGMAAMVNGKFVKMDNPRDKLYEEHDDADPNVVAGHEMTIVESM